LFLGDSIVQGAFVSSPSAAWTEHVAAAWNMEVYNWAVSGSIMSSDIAHFTCCCKPACVWIAYGVNDFNANISLVKFHRIAQNFLSTVTDRSNASVFLQTPIPRLERNPINKNGDSLEDFRCVLREVGSIFPSVITVEGEELLDAKPDCFSDSLHPNDVGAAMIAQRIIQKEELWP
jgi:lysophospholipase L1-like esterase